MSFFDDASLVMIPSGYKTSKVYSVKPTDGTGDLTFSRNSGATRVGPNGLIEKVRTNLVTYSQTLTDASWVGVNIQNVSGGQTDPNGGNTATTFTAFNGFNGIVTKDFATTFGTPYTISIYIKGTASGTINFNRSGVALDPQRNINYTTSWQRFDYSFTADSSTTTIFLGGFFSWDNGEQITFAFAQAETGDIATDYIATTSAAVSVGPTANVPRLDYLGSTCPRLLLEPQRTNLVTYSEQFDNAAWVKAPLGGAALTTVVTANQAVSPDGYTNADKVFMSLGGGTTTSDWSRLQSAAFNVTSGTAYTITFWAWASQSSEVGKKVRAGVGSNTALLDFTLTSTAQRFSVTYTASSTGTDSLLFQIRGAQGLSSTAEFFLWGAQLEAGAYATSYIPTLGASVTRLADAASKTGISSLIGQTEGTLFADITIPTMANTGANLVSISLFNAGLTNLTLFDIYDSGDLLGTCVNGTVQALILKSGLTAGRHKVAFGYKANDFVLYVDGVLVGTDTSGTVGAQDSFGLQYGTSQFIGQQYISQALVFKTRLTNAQLAELTTL